MMECNLIKFQESQYILHFRYLGGKDDPIRGLHEKEEHKSF